MHDGSDAISDWPILNALINAVGGATWVSFHHGGGVGIGYSQHAGQVIVADGTPEAAVRLERVLTTDPGMGVVRHADAGYEIAIEAAKRQWHQDADAEVTNSRKVSAFSFQVDWLVASVQNVKHQLKRWNLSGWVQRDSVCLG